MVQLQRDLFGFLTIKMAGLGIACSGEDGGVIGYEFN